MLRKLMPHVAIVLSGMYFVFFFIDKVNAPMAFINNNITKALLFILCIIVIIESIMLIRIDRRRVRQQMMQRQQTAAPERYRARPADRRDWERGAFAGGHGAQAPAGRRDWERDRRYASGRGYAAPRSASRSRFS